MMNDLKILSYLKEKGIGCKTNLIPLLKELYPTAVNGTVDELTTIAPVVKTLINFLKKESLINTDESQLFWLGTSTASSYRFLDDIKLNCSITVDGVNYLQSFLKEQNRNSADHPNKKNAIILFIEKFWWAVIIPLIIGLILIFIEHKFYE